MLLKLAVPLLALAAMGAVWRRRRRGRLGLGAALAWSGLWIAIAVAALLPGSTEGLAHLLGVVRGLDAVIILSLLALFLLIFRLLARLDDLSMELTELVRRLALERPQRP